MKVIFFAVSFFTGIICNGFVSPYWIISCIKCYKIMHTKQMIGQTDLFCQRILEYKNYCEKFVAPVFGRPQSPMYFYKQHQRENIRTASNL